MNIRLNPGKAKAFTLVEVILSVTIIGIAAAGLIGGITGSFFVMRMARENQRATQVMMERAEALRVFSWTQITNGSIPPTFTDWYMGNSNSPGAVYYGTITITNVPFTCSTSSYNTNMYEVDIGVTWTTDGVTRSRTMSTYVARDGMQNYVY